MLHRWINRLVKSDQRRQQLLRKPRLSWPSLLQTNDQGTLKGIALSSIKFPERMRIKIKARPNMIKDLTVTGKTSMDDRHCAPTFLYQQLDGHPLRVYGRCASIDLVIQEWHSADNVTVQAQLSKSIGDILYTKEFYTCTEPVDDPHTVIDQQIVSPVTKRRHVYPYGGYLGPEGIGEPLFMMLSCNEGQTKVNMFTYKGLMEQDMSPFEKGGFHIFPGVDPKERHKILPLEKLIQYGEISTEMNLELDQDTWVQNYQAESLTRKDGTYEGILIFRKNGKPILKGSS
jgi:hypothetical protein